MRRSSILALLAAPALVAGHVRKGCHHLLKGLEHMDDTELAVHCHMRLPAQQCDSILGALSRRPWTQDTKELVCASHEATLLQKRILVDEERIPEFDGHDFVKSVKKRARSATSPSQQWAVLNQEVERVLQDGRMKQTNSVAKRLLPEFDTKAFVAAVKARAAASPRQSSSKWDALNQEINSVMAHDVRSGHAVKRAKIRARSLDDSVQDKTSTSFKESVNKFKNGVQDAHNKVKTGLSEAHGNLTQGLQELHANASKALSDAHETVTSGLQDAHSKVTGGLAELSQNASDALSQAHEDVKQGLKDLHANATQAFSDAHEAVTSGLQDAHANLSAAAGDAHAKLTKGLQDLHANATQALGDAQDNIAHAANQLGSLLASNDTNDTVQEFERVDAESTTPLNMAAASGASFLAALAAGLGCMAFTRRARSPSLVAAEVEMEEALVEGAE